MIVHILPPATGFPAVTYNTDKVEGNKGELMIVSGFGALQGLQDLRPEDYKNHLGMVSATNKNVKRPQLHAVISAEGKSADKHELTNIGQDWLEAMGYGKQPYLIVFHKDTGNNHIHAVTTRIDSNGKKISDGFEKIRAVAVLNRIVGVDPERRAASDIEEAFRFRLATEAQFRMVLEGKGYKLRPNGDLLEVIKFGRVQATVGVDQVQTLISGHVIDMERKTQLKALFHKYASIYATSLKKGRNGWGSDFSAHLKLKFGIALVFHGSEDKPPYGYSVIDHSGKHVFKGGEIMPLKQMLDHGSSGRRVSIFFARHNLRPEEKLYYGTILRAALYNYPDLTQGLAHQGLVLYSSYDRIKLHDPVTGIRIDTAQLMNGKERIELVMAFVEAQEKAAATGKDSSSPLKISLSGDIDDEAIHGRNRKRKKKARTNSR